MRLEPSRHGSSFGDVVSVIPSGDDLPVYSRDAEIFVGTLEDLERWIQGVEWARRYDLMLFGQKHNGNRQRREQDHRNLQLVKMLKTGKNDE